MDIGWSIWLRLAALIVLAIVVRQAVLYYGRRMMRKRDKQGSNRSKDGRRP